MNVEVVELGWVAFIWTAHGMSMESGAEAVEISVWDWRVGLFSIPSAHEGVSYCNPQGILGDLPPQQL